MKMRAGKHFIRTQRRFDGQLADRARRLPFTMFQSRQLYPY
jgi:hypothetical protein